MFTVVDAKAEFFQLPLDEPSADLCTISTEFGNFRFRRLPSGIVGASERFCEVFHRFFSDSSNVMNCVDDFLIYGNDREEHDGHLGAFLLRCREVSLKLKPSKLQFAQPRVRFLGHTISAEGVRFFRERVSAVHQINNPTSATEAKSFPGIIDYLQKFIPNAATLTAPLQWLTTVDFE